MAGAGLYGAVTHAAELQVAVTNVRNGNGHIQVNVCSAKTFLTDNCPYHGAAVAVPGETVVSVRSVPPGLWAVQAYHDENDNEQVDRDLLGIPTEGIGFSNNAPFRFGPPSFKDAAFTISQAPERITLRLRYFLN